ncbi:MAG: hypothetical protein AAB885_02300 [Patescibacteria group bacterium]
MAKNFLLILLIAAVVVGAAIGGYIYWKKYRGGGSPVSDKLLKELYTPINIPTNPLENINK